MAGSEWEEPIVLRAPYTRSAILRPMTQTNIEIVRRSIEAFNRGDRTGTLADYAPGAEWDTTGCSRMTASITATPGSSSSLRSSAKTWRR